MNVNLKGWLYGTGACALVAAGTLAGSTRALAQDGAIEPVMGVHRGTCADLTAEPAYDFGAFQLVPIVGGGGDDNPAGTVNEEVLGDDGIYDAEDDGYLSDDLDDDGLADIGFDEDDDGVLDDTEIFGEDEDDDDALADAELVIAIDVDPATGLVWKADEDVEADGTELINEGPYSLVVHQSAEAYDTLLACGQVLDLVEEDRVVVPLRPVGDSNYTGVALIEEDDGEYAAYLFQGVTAPGT